MSAVSPVSKKLSRAATFAPWAKYFRGRYAACPATVIGRLVFGTWGIRVRTRLQKPLDHGRVTVDAGQGKWCDAVAVRRLDVRTGANQAVRHIQIVLTYGPGDRCGAIGLRHVHVGFLLQQS